MSQLDPPGTQNGQLTTSNAGEASASKWHTATLIRWGIDPWASTEAIQMRRLFCQSLVQELSRHSKNSTDLVEYAWALENLNYCLSHLPEY
ncbi:hypothetical protein GGI26_005560, partial [Coemansia sp. RSA 1358]